MQCVQLAVGKFKLSQPTNLKFFIYLFSGKLKIYCGRCEKKCSGEVLRVNDKYFHKTCFQCTTCKKSLASGGYFAKENLYYCVVDYQKLYGTKCAACNLYVEGEVSFLYLFIDC